MLGLATSLTAVLDQRKLLAGRIEELLEAHPLSKVLISMPGIRVRTGARILIDVGDGSRFPSGAYLAADASLALATRDLLTEAAVPGAVPPTVAFLA